MILADKIIQLRKKNGWSQEELADQLDVSRQAVSKWEGAQATPDLNKLLAMSRLFGVTTDYLLKDEMEAEEAAPEDGGAPLRRVSLAEATAYVAWREKAAALIAIGVLLCVVGAAVMLALQESVNYASLGISNQMASGLGLGILLIFVAAAVALFVYCGQKNEPYRYLEQEAFETEYGVAGMAEKKRREGMRAHTALLCAGVALCVLAFLPLIVESLLPQSLRLCAALLLAGCGAALCVLAGVRRASLDRLLQQGDYSPQGKRFSRFFGPIAAAYWLIVTAVFLAWSFLGKSWYISWVIWPVAGVLFAALAVLCRVLISRKEG